MWCRVNDHDVVSYDTGMHMNMGVSNALGDFRRDTWTHYTKYDYEFFKMVEFFKTPGVFKGLGWVDSGCCIGDYKNGVVVDGLLIISLLEYFMSYEADRDLYYVYEGNNRLFFKMTDEMKKYITKCRLLVKPVEKAPNAMVEL